jgi:hypothetical protein
MRAIKIGPSTGPRQAAGGGNFLWDRSGERSANVNYATLAVAAAFPYRGTSLIRYTPPVGPYSSPIPRVLW